MWPLHLEEERAEPELSCVLMEVFSSWKMPCEGGGGLQGDRTLPTRPVKILWRQAHHKSPKRFFFLPSSKVRMILKLL